MPRLLLSLVALLALAFAPAPAQTKLPGDPVLTQEELTGSSGSGGRLAKTAAEATASYYVNKNAQPDGDHEVHKASCSYFPAQKNRLYLGDFRSCDAAVREARKHYAQADGCYYCARDCDTG